MGRLGGDRSRAAQELLELDAWLEDRRPNPLKTWSPPVPWLAPLWDGYWDLESDRVLHVLPMGGSITGGIPYLARAAWLRDHGFDGEDFESALWLWGRMESARQRYENERRRG